MGVPLATEAGLLIDGDERQAQSQASFETLDPSTGSVVAQVARGGGADVDAAVRAARTAFRGWRRTQPRYRADLLRELGARLREDANDLGQIGAVDCGLPLSQARVDAEVAGRYFEFYAGLADKLGGRTVPQGADYLNFTVREPWGVCGIIVPFNTPYQVASRSVAAALAAGNTVVVKAPEQSPLGSLALGRLALEAGIPPGVVNIVTGFGDAGAALAGHPGVAHITFTGAVSTGQAVLAASVPEVTPVTLELGGKSPQIVFEDADIAAAADSIVNSVMYYAGQTCTATSRVLVQEGIKDDLLRALQARAQALRVGAAVDDPDLGPVITSAQRERVVEIVRAAITDGAKLVAGLEEVPPDLPSEGFYVSPTVLADVPEESRAVQEEIFGPVTTVASFATVDDAIQSANGTEFGLTAGIWTRDLDRALHLTREIEAGQVFVNTYGVGGGGVEMAFGGYKKSGFGREKGVEGYLEYTQIKNVCVRVSAEAASNGI